MKISLINKTIGREENKTYAEVQANNRSHSLSQRKSSEIFCALKIPRGFFWKLNINKPN